jgi:putative FmdB family regulatory protein
MPLYEYECDSCGHRFERIQKFSDPAPDACPTCGGPVRKLISSPAIQFKGSGFYITDYPKAGQSAKDGSAGEPAAKDAASSERPSGDKPATAAEKPTLTSEPKTATPAKTPATTSSDKT